MSGVDVTGKWQLRTDLSNSSDARRDPTPHPDPSEALKKGDLSYRNNGPSWFLSEGGLLSAKKPAAKKKEGTTESAFSAHNLKLPSKDIAVPRSRKTLLPLVISNGAAPCSHMSSKKK
jgi:hypothetical protein